jgi:acyl-CoA thioester hydrolase
VRYELAIFKQGESVAAAVGYFVHVFVDRETQRPVSMPATIRAALERLVLPALLVKSLNYESGGTH